MKEKIQKKNQKKKYPTHQAPKFHGFLLIWDNNCRNDLSFSWDILKLIIEIVLLALCVVPHVISIYYY